MNLTHIFFNFFEKAGSVERWEMKYFMGMVFICTGASKFDPAQRSCLVSLLYNN